jgi:peptide/nickel transport system permease protein
MRRYIVFRIVRGVITLFFAMLIIFFVARVTGDPIGVMLPDSASPEDRAYMSRHMGFDKSLPEQYLIFVSNMMKGDLGRSVVYQAPVTEFILSRLPATLKLAGLAALFSFLISLPAGVLAAVKRNKWQDYVLKVFALLGQALPTFWLGILLVQVFAVSLGWFPAAGHGGWLFWILPAFALGFHSTAGVLRLTRSSMLDIIDSDFVRLARIKGVPETAVIWKHALRNALIPVVTFSNVVYIHLLMGSIAIETVFAWPGVGRLAYEAVMKNDYPLVQGLVIMFVGFYVIANLTTDIMYVYLDPRIKYSKK